MSNCRYLWLSLSLHLTWLSSAFAIIEPSQMASASQVISGRENGIRRSAARPRSWPVGVLRACGLSLSLRFTQGFKGQFAQNCQCCVTHNIANEKKLFFIFFLFYVAVCTRLVLGLVHWNASVFWMLGWCSSMETWCVSQLLLLYAETHGCLYLFYFFCPPPE